MPLNKNLREFIEYLNSNEVEYLLVGALAVSWHGFPRYSADIDIFIHRTETNAECILKALRQFGFEKLAISAADFLVPERVIQLGHEPNRIDLLTSISGVDFEEAWLHRVQGEMDGTPVTIIGRNALMRNKAATGRAKDRIDLEELSKQGEQS